jgi:dephospho-CoA kinase
MGAGKSTVAKVFEHLGAKRVDADAEGKNLLHDRKISRSIVEAFGKGVADSKGRIDTIKLGKEAFKSPEAARTLSKITRDPLIRRIRARIRELGHSANMIVVDAALLPEWDSRDWIDVLIVVDSGEEESVRRSCAYSRFRAANVRSRMKEQFSRRRKAGCADIIIPNFGSVEDLKERARRVFWTLMGITGKE